MFGYMRVRRVFGNRPKKMLFYRDFRKYSGGHQKVADYFKHCLALKGVDPYVSFSKNSRFDSSNPWYGIGRDRLVRFEPLGYGLVFLAGQDWMVFRAAEASRETPVLNLIQHVRHADPENPLYGFLAERAIRICVSSDVKSALVATNRVNGPIFTIENGHHIPAKSSRVKDLDVAIIGAKEPEFARALAARLGGMRLRLKLVDEFVPRSEVLGLLGRARIGLVLPNRSEGFYLPALESMALADLTIVPDVPGPRSYAVDKRNCLLPGYEVEALVKAVEEGIRICGQASALRRYRSEAKKTVKWHSLARERRKFADLLRSIDQLWRS